MITGKTGIKLDYITNFDPNDGTHFGERIFLIQNDKLQYIRLTETQTRELVDMIACVLYDLDSAAPHVR